MINTLLILFYEYFKIGIFAIGGGYATIPFLFHLIKVYHWFTHDELANMIAISNMTPGPVGINMATYTGFKTSGILGSFFATMGIILGPLIITLVTIYFINKFKDSKIMKNILEGLKPTACALLCVVMINLITKNFFIEGIIDSQAIIITVILFAIYKYVKKFPSLIVLIGGILGVLLNIFHN